MIARTRSGGRINDIDEEGRLRWYSGLIDRPNEEDLINTSLRTTDITKSISFLLPVVNLVLSATNNRLIPL